MEALTLQNRLKAVRAEKKGFTGRIGGNGRGIPSDNKLNRE